MSDALTKSFQQDREVKPALRIKEKVRLIDNDGPYAIQASIISKEQDLKGLRSRYQDVRLLPLAYGIPVAVPNAHFQPEKRQWDLKPGMHIVGQRFGRNDVEEEDRLVARRHRKVSGDQRSHHGLGFSGTCSSGKNQVLARDEWANRVPLKPPKFREAAVECLGYAGVKRGYLITHEASMASSRYETTALMDCLTRSSTGLAIFFLHTISIPARSLTRAALIVYAT